MRSGRRSDVIEAQSRRRSEASEAGSGQVSVAGWVSVAGSAWPGQRGRVSVVDGQGERPTKGMG